MHIDSKLHFFARCREVLRRRHLKPFYKLERPPGVERLEPRFAPSVTGTVSGTTVNLTGDAGADTYSFGVSGGGNLTHTFPVGAGGGMFASNEDFDSATPGVQSVKADKTADVRIQDSGSNNALSFEGLPNAISIGGLSSRGFATSDSGRFDFSGITSITGTPQSDNITFRSGIVGGEEQISINGGAGNDSIEVAGTDAAVIDGGTGNDFINAKNKAAATINGGDGNDTVFTATVRTVIDGGKDNDLIDVKAAKRSETTVVGGDGNDTVTTAADQAMIDGGIGNDKLTITSGKKSVVKVMGGDGDDTINGSAAPATIDGGKGNDLIQGGKGDQSINAGDGEDTVIPGKGKNTVVGGNGNDSVIGSAKTLFWEEGGSFVLTDSMLFSTIGGANFVDVLQGVKHVALMGGDGDDRIDSTGYSFASTIGGAGGNDQLLGSPSGSVLALNIGPGDDSLYVLQPTLGTGQGIDTLSNIDGAFVVVNDSLGHFLDARGFRLGGITMIGGNGDDTVALADDLKIFNVFSGGEGNDRVFLGASRSKIDGGPGTDVLSGDRLIQAGVKIVSNGTAGTATTKTFNDRSKLVSVVSRLFGFETFEGSDLNDTIALSPLRNAILAANGGPGNDLLTAGGRGAANLDGGDGDDILRATAAAFVDHKLSGGKGFDKLTVSGRGGGFLFGGDDADLLINNAFGGLNGGDGDDTLVSGARGNSIDAGKGADLVKAGKGNDFVDLVDGSGNDTADGGPGNDILSSDSGDTTTNFP